MGFRDPVLWKQSKTVPKIRIKSISQIIGIWIVDLPPIFITPETFIVFFLSQKNINELTAVIRQEYH